MHKEKELLVIEYLKSKSPKLKEQVVAAYTPLVEYIARKLSFKKEDVPDLVQVGTIGLLKSLENFNPKLNIAFSTFASSNIIGEIRHYIRDKSRIVKLPRKLQEHYSKVRNFIKTYSQDHGKYPTVKDIAKGTELTEEEILESMEAGQTTQVVSLDKPVFSGSSKSQSQEQFSLIDSLGIEFKDESYLNKEVLKQATQIFENEGVDGLEQTAKMHFKTVYEAQGLKPPEKPKFIKKQ